MNDFSFLTDIPQNERHPSGYDFLFNNYVLSTFNVRYFITRKKLPSSLTVYKKENNRHLKRVPLVHWTLINGKKEGDHFILKAPDTKRISLIFNEISLKQNSFYVLYLKAKAPHGAKENVFLDLVRWPNYLHPELNLVIWGKRIQKNYKVFFRIINTGKIPQKVSLRIYTHSKKPIYIKDIAVMEYKQGFPLHQSTFSKDTVLYKNVFKSKTWYVYENRNYLPRAFSVIKLIPIRNLNEVKEFFYLYKFNPAKEALIYNQDIYKIGRLKFFPARVRIQSYDTDTIVIKTLSRGKAFVVLSDQYYPGWHAYVDGEKVPIYKVNGVLRGVVVPRGKHTIEFRYEPLLFYIAFIFSVCILVMNFIVLFLVR